MKQYLCLEIGEGMTLKFWVSREGVTLMFRVERPRMEWFVRRLKLESLVRTGLFVVKLAQNYVHHSI